MTKSDYDAERNAIWATYRAECATAESAARLKLAELGNRYLAAKFLAKCDETDRRKAKVP